MYVYVCMYVCIYIYICTYTHIPMLYVYMQHNLTSVCRRGFEPVNLKLFVKTSSYLMFIVIVYPSIIAVS